jgi:Putative phage tail protein
MGDVLVGYRYLFGIHMGISRGPVDELCEIKVGDKTAWRGSITNNGETTIDAPNLFGGEGLEGGIQGTLTLMFGGVTQTAPSALATVLKSPMPGFRRRFTVFFDGLLTAMNPYPKPWKFRVRRALAGWDGDPWYPERCVISMIRPTSSAEIQAATPQTANVQFVQTSTWALSSGVRTITLTPGGPLVSIDSVSFFGDWRGEGWQIVRLLEGVHYTRAGNVLTLIEPVSFSATLFRPVDITYTATVPLTTPGSGPGGLGNALIKAMNPAHIIYECYTNREWGRGLARDRFDDESWRTTADRLFIEGFGICLRWTRRDAIQTFIQAILNHIGGVIFTDRKTGKIKILLLRDDYSVDSIPLFDADNGLKSITENAVSMPTNMINEIVVKYRDPVTNEDRMSRASNLASVQASGGVVNSMTIDFPGLPTAALAAKIAKRELRVRSPSIRRYQLTVDRRGFNLVPGGLLRVQDMARGVPDTVLRIGHIDYGSQTNGEIKITAIQDVFGLPKTGYTTIGPPQWTPPNTRPCLSNHRVFEVPYRSLYRQLSAAEFAFVDNTSAYIGAVCQEGQPLNTGYNIAVKPGAPSVDENPTDSSYVCPI